MQVDFTTTTQTHPHVPSSSTPTSRALERAFTSGHLALIISRILAVVLNPPTSGCSPALFRLVSVTMDGPMCDVRRPCFRISAYKGKAGLPHVNPLFLVFAFCWSSLFLSSLSGIVGLMLSHGVRLKRHGKGLLRY
ncbi:hypothetical protein BDV95DRAFT_44867 [Massariosphaeria phaeospora]|uniref:Uncharacterized protein n=1 Tax=Massariosphaeria phaeospora TaxID=100035 RepID=A0A7C8IFC5_9PLEO|nr:hypothetical protein BDV95DRAFT_44867 [Massariosphaeria phaeospora]